MEAWLTDVNAKKVRYAHLKGLVSGYAHCARLVFVAVVLHIGSQEVQYEINNPDDFRYYLEENKITEKSDNVFVAIWIIFATISGAGMAF